MGCGVAGLFPFGEEITEQKSKEYKDIIAVSPLAIKGYEKIKKGDYVITCLHYS